MSKAYSSLVLLFDDLSESWSKNFSTVIQSVQTKMDIFEIETSASKQPNFWLTEPSTTEAQNHTYNITRANFHMNDLFGMNPKLYRDWNEEVYNCRLLPSDVTMERINRLKGLKKLQSDFIEAAYCGAKAIVENRLMPFNLNAPKHEHCYIFNNIFYTWAVDDYREEGINNNLLKNKEITTYSYSNNDMRNLELVVQADIKELNTINTVLINYRGYRVVCQSMIPGILGCDTKVWAMHGTIDEGETIKFDKTFNDSMVKLCRYFNLKESVDYKDKEGKLFNMAGPVEVKAIKGYDNRMFVYDLQRLSPRD